MPVAPRSDASVGSVNAIHLPSMEDPGLFGISESLTGTTLTSFPDMVQMGQPGSCPAHYSPLQPAVSGVTASSPGGHLRRRGFVGHAPSEAASPVVRESLSHEAAFAHALLTGRKRLANNDVIMDSPSPKRGRSA